MAIRWDEFLANLEKYRKALPPDEPIVLPRREAKRRAANKEQRHRFTFDTDTENYADLHKEKNRILIALGENPTMFGLWLRDVMRSWSDDRIKLWKETYPHAPKESGTES